MKVAIITMHCPLNYGAVLQTYALQTYIESLGHSVEIIDYRPEYIVYDQSLTYVGNEKFQRNFLTRLIYIICKIPSKTQRILKFHRFYKKRLNLTERIYKTFNDLVNFCPNADHYICGSDQIWSYNNGAYKDPAYFLGFSPKAKKRSSYAPSGNFPAPLPSEMEKCIIAMINQLDNVSVREENTKILIQPLVNKEITEVLDPVFLHDKDFWTSVNINRNKRSEKYVLIYLVGDSDNIIRTVIPFAQKRRLPIYCITSSQREIHGISKKIIPSPDEFITLINDAEYVFTNSFHGTAFSIILEKQFWVYRTQIANSRIVSLLKKVDLLHRLVTDNDSDLSSEIDFSKVRPHIEKWVETSKTYIKNILCNITVS